MRDHHEMIQQILRHENLSGFSLHTRVDELSQLSTEELFLILKDLEDYDNYWKSQPEYWARLTDTLTNNSISPEDFRDFFEVKGEIKDA